MQFNIMSFLISCDVRTHLFKLTHGENNGNIQEKYVLYIYFISG